jgi:hypothetical protein
VLPATRITSLVIALDRRVDTENDMPRFLIVRYAAEDYPDGTAPLVATVQDSYSANETGVTRKLYESREQAEPDLARLNAFNPSAAYGIVELDESLPT